MAYQSSDHATHETVMARCWPWLSGESTLRSEADFTLHDVLVNLCLKVNPPPKKHQLDISISNCKQQVDDFVVELTS